jgi:hypothetical protein
MLLAPGEPSGSSWILPGQFCIDIMWEIARWSCYKPAARQIADQDPVGTCRVTSVLDQHALNVDELTDAKIRALTPIA